MSKALGAAASNSDLNRYLDLNNTTIDVETSLIGSNQPTTKYTLRFDTKNFEPFLDILEFTIKQKLKKPTISLTLVENKRMQDVVDSYIDGSFNRFLLEREDASTLWSAAMKILSMTEPILTEYFLNNLQSTHSTSSQIVQMMKDLPSPQQHVLGALISTAEMLIQTDKKSSKIVANCMAEMLIWNQNNQTPLQRNNLIKLLNQPRDSLMGVQSFIKSTGANIQPLDTKEWLAILTISGETDQSLLDANRSIGVVDISEIPADRSSASQRHFHPNLSQLDESSELDLHNSFDDESEVDIPEIPTQYIPTKANNNANTSMNNIQSMSSKAPSSMSSFGLPRVNEITNNNSNNNTSMNKNDSDLGQVSLEELQDIFSTSLISPMSQDYRNMGKQLSSNEDYADIRTLIKTSERMYAHIPGLVRAINRARTVNNGNLLPWQEYMAVTLSLLSSSAQEYIHEHDIHYDSQLPSAFRKQAQPDSRKSSSLISGNQLIDESFDSSSSISSALPPSTKAKVATSSGSANNPSTQNNSKNQANTSQTIRGYDDYNHFDDTDEDEEEIIHNKQNKSQINNSRIDDKNLRNQSHRQEEDEDEEDYDPSLGHQVLSSNEFDSMPKRQLNTSYANKDNERKKTNPSQQTTSNQWNAVRTAPIRSSVGSMYSDDPSELGEEEDEDRDFKPSQHNRSYDSKAQQGLLLPDSDEEPDIQQNQSMGNKSNNSIKWKKRVHLSQELRAQDLSQQQNATNSNTSQQEIGNSDEEEDQQHEFASDSEPSSPPKPVKKPANNTGSKFFSLTSIDHSAEDSMSAPNSPVRDEEKPTLNVFKEDKPTLITSSTQPLTITLSSEPKIPSTSSSTTVNPKDNSNQPNALLQSVSLDSPVKTHINPLPVNNSNHTNNNTNISNATTQPSKGSTGLSSLFGFNKKKKDSSSRDPSPQTNMNNNNVNNNINTTNPPINATLTRSSSNEQLLTTDIKDKQPQKSNLFSTVKNVFQVKGMLSRHGSPLTRTPSQEQLQQQPPQQQQQGVAFSLNSSSSHGIADQANRPGRSLSIDSGSTNTSAIDHPSPNNNMNKPINIPTQVPSHPAANTQNSNPPMKKTLSLSNMFLRRSRDQSDSSEPPSPLQLNPVDINPDPTKKKSLFSAPFRRSQENPIPTSQPPIQAQPQALAQPQSQPQPQVKTFSQPQPIINTKQEIKIPVTQTVNSQPQSTISNQSQPPQMIQVPQVISQPPSKPVVTIQQPSQSIPIKAKEPIVVQSYQPPPPIQQNQPKNPSPIQTIQKQPSRDENVPSLPRRDSIFEPTEPLRQPLVIPADSRRSESPPHRSQSMNELPRRDSIFEPSEPITDLNHLFNDPLLTSGQRTMSMNNIDSRASRGGQPPLARQNTISSSLVQQSIPTNPRQSLRASSPQVLRHIQRENPKLNGRGLALLLRQHFQPNEEELMDSSLADAMASSTTNGPAASIKINRRSYQKLSSSTTLSHHSKTQKKLQKLLNKSQAINNEVLERQMGLVHVPKPPPRLVAPGLSQPISEKENDEKDNVKVLLLDQLLENPMNHSLLPKGLNFDERLLLEMNAIVHAKQHGKPPALSASQASSRLSYSVHHSKHYAMKPLDPIPLSAVGDDLYSVDYDRNKEYLIKLFQQIKARDEPLQQRIFTSKDIEETRQLIKQCHEETKQPLHTYQTMKEQAKNSVLHDLRKQFQQKFQHFQEHGLHYSRLSSPYFLLDQQQRFPEEYSQLTNAMHTASLASWRFPDSTETSLGIYFAGNLKKKLRSGWRQRYYAIMLDPIDNPNLPSSRKTDPTSLTALAATTGGLRFYLVEYSKCLDTIWGHVPYHFKRLFELSSLLSVVTNTKSNKGGKEFVLCFYVDPRGNNKPNKPSENNTKDSNNNVVSSGIAGAEVKEPVQLTKDEKDKQANEEEEKKKKEDEQGKPVENNPEKLEEKQEINEQSQPKEKDEKETVDSKEKPQEEKPIKPPKPQTTKGSIANSEDLDDDEDEDMEDDEGSVASSNAESIYFYRPGTLDHIPVKSRSPDALKDSLTSKKKQSKNWIKIGLKTESPDERLHWTKLLHALAPQAYVNTLQY